MHAWASQFTGKNKNRKASIIKSCKKQYLL